MIETATNALKFNFPHLKNGEDDIGFMFEIHDEDSNAAYSLWLGRLAASERIRRGLPVKQKPMRDEVLE